MNNINIYFIKSIDDNDINEMVHKMLIISELREQAPYIDISIYDYIIKNPTLNKEYVEKITGVIYKYYRDSIRNVIETLNNKNAIPILIKLEIKKSYIYLMFKGV